jgi:hypothetical protein
MSKHISRAMRWTQVTPSEHRSAEGRVYYRAGEWHAVVTYRVLDPEAPPPLEEPTTWRVGKFKRARNAMIGVERKVQELQNRHGDHLVLLEPER